MFAEYIDALTTGLLNLNIGIEVPLAAQIAKIAIYSIVVYTIMAIVIIIGRATKQLQIVNTIGIKAICSGCALFLLGSIIALYINRDTMIEPFSYFNPQLLLMMLRHLDKALYLIILLAVLIFVLVILFGMLSFCFRMCMALFAENIAANGILKGLLLSIYELFSGVDWLAVIMCGISFGIAIIIFPFLLLYVAAFSGKRAVYYYD